LVVCIDLDFRGLLKRFESDSATVYLVLAYPGPEETCNCHEKKYHDSHLEIYDQSLDHAPKTGDSTGIVCEVTRELFRGTASRGSERLCAKGKA
jgi:hypothetical protein